MRSYDMPELNDSIPSRREEKHEMKHDTAASRRILAAAADIDERARVKQFEMQDYHSIPGA